jgi:hypothetical protein
LGAQLPLALIAEGVLDVYDHKWQKGFVALTRFKARKGHCRVPRGHVEGAYQLGWWVAAQRSSAKIMSTECRKRLDAIGFVWEWREDAWEKGFAALTKFKSREGG